MTKFVFVAVLAVLAIALYSIPSQSADNKGDAARSPSYPAPAAAPAPDMKDKDMQHSSGEMKGQPKNDRSRTAQRKPSERTKTPEQPKTEPQPSK